MSANEREQAMATALVESEAWAWWLRECVLPEYVSLSQALDQEPTAASTRWLQGRKVQLYQLVTAIYRQANRESPFETQALTRWRPLAQRFESRFESRVVVDPRMTEPDAGFQTRSEVPVTRPRSSHPV